MINPISKIRTCQALELKLSRNEWEDWINELASNFPEKITFSNLSPAVKKIAGTIFKFMDEHNIEFLSFKDIDNNDIKIYRDFNEIEFEVEMELTYQLDIKYKLKL
jgi:hypothetical protein